jgi:chemotaxis protein methyltransferase CheR
MREHEENLTSRDYARLRDFVFTEAGIRLGPEKKTMLEGRLRRRLRSLHMDSCAAYCTYLFGPDGMRHEKVHFIDAVTTNKTDFFREPAHFEFLARRALPEMAERAADRPLLVWSAGCSSGEEPYTLAMVLSEFGQEHPGFRFSILATDISTAVLARAELGIYPAESVEAVPPALRRKYLMRSRNSGSHQVRIAPELRRFVVFRRLNFMDADYGLTEPADAIFCRNVIIYFDRPTQQRILSRLAGCLAPAGYLFVGHSETLHDMNLPLAPVAPALYRRIHART